MADEESVSSLDFLNESYVSFITASEEKKNVKRYGLRNAEKKMNNESNYLFPKL